MLRLLLARALAVCFPFHFMKLHYPAEKERGTYPRYRPSMYVTTSQLNRFLQQFKVTNLPLLTSFPTLDTYSRI